MHFDFGMFLIILVVAEATGFAIVALSLTPGAVLSQGKTVERWRRRNFKIGVAGFMFCVALAAGLSEPAATPAAAVAGAGGLVFLFVMAFGRIGAPS
jgi:hypothetical protein